MSTGCATPRDVRPTSCATASPASASARRSRAPSRRSTSEEPDLVASHAQLLEILLDRSPGRVLDLGCGHGRLGAELQALRPPCRRRRREARRRRERLDHFVVADLEQGIPLAVREQAHTTVSSPPTCWSTSRPRAPARRAAPPARRWRCRAGQRAEHRPLVPAPAVVSGRFDYDPAASSTATTCASSPVAASPGWLSARVADHGHSTDRAAIDVVDRGARRCGGQAAPHRRLDRPRPRVADHVRLPVHAHARAALTTTQWRWPAGRSCSTPCRRDRGRRRSRRPRRRPGSGGS